MDRQAQQRIAALPFVKGICPIGQVPVQIKDRQVFGVKELTPPYVICVGFDPEQFLKMNSVEWIQGDPETAMPRLRQGDAILVADRFLTARGLGVGDTLTLGGKDVNHEYEIVGVVSSAGLDIATAALRRAQRLQRVHDQLRVHGLRHGHRALRQFRRLHHPAEAERRHQRRSGDRAGAGRRSRITVLQRTVDQRDDRSARGRGAGRAEQHRLLRPACWPRSPWAT